MHASIRPRTLASDSFPSRFEPPEDAYKLYLIRSDAQSFFSMFGSTLSDPFMFFSSPTAGQSLNAASSWTPTEAGTYEVTAFAWESIENPTTLSPTATIVITVN